MNAATPDENLSRQRPAVRIVTVASVLVVLLAVLAGGWWLSKGKANQARARWKESALDRLMGLSITNGEIRRELDELKTNATPTTDFVRWAHDHVLLMTNGEYIVYAFRHGRNGGFVDHLFLGRGSDGRWLYSTFHFCNHMVGILGDDPPGSISDFAKKYSSRAFDGKSDECLRRTWP